MVRVAMDTFLRLRLKVGLRQDCGSGMASSSPMPERLWAMRGESVVAGSSGP